MLATANLGKLREYRALLADLGVDLLAQPATVPPLAETGATFAENARMKARHAARHTGLPALGDDSGIEVHALGGWPGVRSARFAGDAASDAQRIAAVLGRLGPGVSRAAAMVTVLALVLPAGMQSTAEGRLEGSIAPAPAGTSGFGYDPVFIPRGHTLTLAQLGQREKNRLSQRARAVAALRPALAAWSRG